MAFLELFDETLDINSTENYELAVQAGVDGFSFCLLDTLRNKFVLIRSFEPEDNKYYNAEAIKEFIEKDDFLTRQYRKTRIIMPSSKFTLVPVPLYDPAKKEEYYNFNYNTDNGSKIISNKLNDPDAFIVFSVPKSFYDLLDKIYPGIFPLIHIQPLFDYIGLARKNIPGDYIHIHVERDSFNLVIFNNNLLKFCNSFSYRNITDILYFVLNVFNKLGIRQDDTVHLSGVTEKSDDLSSNLSIYIRTVKFAEPNGQCNFSYVFNEIGLHRFINLFSVFNCG